MQEGLGPIAPSAGAEAPMNVVPDWPSLVQVNLYYGRDRSRTIGDLQESLGVSRRIVEKAVETLRLQGVLKICND